MYEQLQLEGFGENVEELSQVGAMSSLLSSTEIWSLSFATASRT